MPAFAVSLSLRSLSVLSTTIGIARRPIASSDLCRFLGSMTSESNNMTKSMSGPLLINRRSPREFTDMISSHLTPRTLHTSPFTRLPSNSSKMPAGDPISSLVDTNVKIMAATQELSESTLSFSSAPKNVMIVTKPDKSLIPNMTAVVDFLLAKDVTVWVQDSYRDDFSTPSSGTRAVKFWSEEMCQSRNMADIIELVVTLGGDGTVLYTSRLFQHRVPPTVPFFLGTLGFLTPFDFSEYSHVLTHLFDGGEVKVNLRMRLDCSIHRCADESCDVTEVLSVSGGTVNTNRPKTDPSVSHQVLNEVVIDRGLSPSILAVDIFTEDRHLTTVQADGIVCSTPTGSTAYSLSAGASLVHPELTSMILTPICPHTLTNRPMVIPCHVRLRFSISPLSKRGGYVSFDGRYKYQLNPGDNLFVRNSVHPFVTISREDTTKDWFRGLVSCLGWGERNVKRSGK